MADSLFSKEINMKDHLVLEVDSGEALLLAIISNKEYICYAINIKGNNYLMFIDDTILGDLIFFNKSMITIVEDNEHKTIELFFRNGEFLQKTMNNITVTLIKYSGSLNQKNIIKYNEYYFKNLNNKYMLKDYERHLKALDNDIGMKSEIKIYKANEVRHSYSPDCQISKDCLYCITVTICVVILLILGIIFPSFGEFLGNLSNNFNSFG